MTIKELIGILSKILSKMNGDLRVMTHGYEGGFNDVFEVDGPTDMFLDVYKDKWYYGPHDNNLDAKDKKKHKKVKAIVL